MIVFMNHVLFIFFLIVASKSKLNHKVRNPDKNKQKHKTSSRSPVSATLRDVSDVLVKHKIRSRQKVKILPNN